MSAVCQITVCNCLLNVGNIIVLRRIIEATLRNFKPYCDGKFQW